MSHLLRGVLPADGLLALALLNPWLLVAGTALVAMPILIHLLSRRRYRRIEWGATQFLLAAEKESRRRMRFEQWLLLALRCLAMLLLGLVLARPFVQPGALASVLGGAGRTHHVVVLDDSASMQFGAPRGSDFERAREAALRLLAWIEQAAPGDALSVVLTSQEATLVERASSTGGLDGARQELRRLAASDVPARPRAALQRAAELVGESGDARSRVHILSDFQRSEWLAPDEQGESVFEPLKSAGGTDLALSLISAAAPRRDNVSLHGLAIDRRQVIAGVPAALSVEVTNHGARRRDADRLLVDIDAGRVATVELRAIDPGRTERASFEVAFPDAGHHRLTVSLATADGLPADDVLRAVVPVTDALSVLLVNGAPSSDPLRDEVHLLRTALSPPGPFPSGIIAEVVDPEQIGALSLAAFDAVVLANVPPLDELSVAALHRYVRAGGGVIIFLGDQAGEADAFNRALFAGPAGLMPVELERVVTWPDTGVRLLREGEHPLTAALSPAGEVLSEYVRFRRAWRALPREGAPVQIVARFADAERTPALLEHMLGAGRVLLFTSTVDLDWNDWARALDGSYVVTMLDMTRYVARQQVGRLALAAGEPFSLPLPRASYQAQGLFRAPPDAQRTPVAGRPRDAAGDADDMLLDGPPADRAGFWTVELQPRGVRPEVRPLAVNIAEIESDLRTAEPSLLSAALGGLRHEFLDAQTDFGQRDDRAQRELWATLLALLLIVLMGEQALAWWFGASAAPSPRRVGLLGRLISWPLPQGRSGTRS